MKSVKKIVLGGEGTLISEEHDINVPIFIPGSIFDALIEAGKLEDPFYGLNEQKSDWIYNSEWIILHTFKIEESFLSERKAWIKFYGIDTFAHIYLNDKLLGDVDNMHAEYEYEITKILKEGDNELKVVIESPVKNAHRLYEEDNRRISGESFSVDGRSYTHKSQYSYGWDWGPILPDMGIWRKIELISLDPSEAHLRNFHVLEAFKDDFSSVNIKIKINSDISAEEKSKIEYNVVICYDSPEDIKFKETIYSQTPSISCNIDDPKLWWIHELGTPHLYNITVNMKYQGHLIDSISEKIGLRKIELIRRKDQWGESFFFELNGVPIFAKGANWIPHHSFIPKGTRLGLYRTTLEAAKDANMTMLRVWGGGIMEDDQFYDLCDELGILVWQDFPYACRLSPATRDEDGNHNKFYYNAKSHAIQNVIRLRNRTSLALWCGNNEIESSVLNLKLEDPVKGPLLRGYCELVENLLPSIVAKNDPTRAYWPCSPSNGGSNNTCIYKRDSNYENYGDSHFWTVWHGSAPFTAYRENFSRFQSEFGFESFPEVKTCLEFCPPDQFEFESPIMKNHQKNPAGNKKIMDYMKKRFKIPDDFEKQVILSQLTQAEAIEYGVDHWRRRRGNIGNERCMGALYWQLNDCWPVASWSSLDYSKKLAEKYGIPGRWKALHYFARRFYKPVIASIAESKQQCELWVVNALNSPKHVVLEWQIFDLEGNQIRKNTHEINLEPCSSRLIHTEPVGDLFELHSVDMSGTFSQDENGFLNFSGDCALKMPFLKNGKYFGLDENKEASMQKTTERVASLLADFIGKLIDVEIVIDIKENQNSDENQFIFGEYETKFSGECLLDENGYFCIKKPLVLTNPILYDIPLFEIIEPFLEKKEVKIKINHFATESPVIIQALIKENGEIIAETFRSFIAPGKLPLKDPNLSLKILGGEDKKWEVEITAFNVSLYTHLYSKTLDFWADDNYFLLKPNKRKINISVLETTTKEKLANELTVKSLYELIN